MTARFAFAALALAAGAASPAAAIEASVEARATIVEPMMVRMVWQTAMPSVRAEAGGAQFAAPIPSMSMGMMMPTNGRLVVRREDETGEPVTAPGAFDVTREGRTGALLVRTRMAEYGRAPSSFMGGALAGGSAASIGVGFERPLLMSNDSLVVLVQYN
ncbi:hypothetical protein [Phenylobacterium sp.]|jgi:hypothetical protein|uniref:hypothetical protein n=1 Tax=Phenylobacterium sp. TaxID=1871053 RepID=UPI0037C74DE8